MSLRWAEGFEIREASGYFSALYASNTGSFSRTTGRKHGSGAALFSDSLTTPALVGSVSNTWYVQIALRKSSTSSPSGDFKVVEFQDGTGEQCNLNMIDSPSIPGNFRLEMRRGSTVLATSGDFTQSSNHTRGWHTFILKVVVRTGTDGSYELRHFDYANNSTTVFSGVSSNLASQGTDGADRVVITAGNANVVYDDILIWDDVNSPSGTVFADAFPSQPFILLGTLPDGDGNQTDWDTSSGGTHYVLVDDPADTVVDSDEILSQTVGDIDLFTLQDLAASLSPTGTVVRAVISDTRYAMKNSGTRNVQVRVRSGGSEADQGTAIVANTTDTGQELRIMEQNPVTSSAWLRSELDALELGVRVQS